MKNAFRNARLVFAVSCVALTSCHLDDFDTADLEDFNVSVGVKSPIAHGSITVEDIIEDIDDDEGLIHYGEDGLYYLQYRQEDVLNFDALDLFQFNVGFPAFTNQVSVTEVLGVGELPPGGAEVNITGIPEYTMDEASVNLDILDDEDVYLTRVKLARVNFRITVDQPNLLNTELQMNLLNCSYENGDPVVLEHVFSTNNNVYSETVEDVYVNFDGNEQLDYQIKLNVQDSETPVWITNEDEVRVSFNVDDVEFDVLYGDFGQQSIAIPSGRLDLDMSVLDEFGGGLNLVNPRIELEVVNGVGAPANVYFGIGAFENGQLGETLTFNEGYVALQYPAAAGEQVDYVQTMDKSNSNIVDFVASLPSDFLMYDGRIVVNPAGATPDEENFISMDSRVQLDVNVVLPLEVQANDLVITDTLDVDFDLDAEVNEAILWIDYENNIPFEVVAELIFIDQETGEQLSKPVVLDGLVAAPADANGVSTGSSSGEIRIELDEEDATALFTADGAVLNAYLRSPDNGETPGALRAHDQIDLRIKVQTRATFN